jgi:FemAB-related protein (PEP-CTERM system-associated)
MKISLATREHQQVWDDYVASHKDATPYHRFAWGLACAEAYQQKQHYLIAWDDADKIVGVLPSIRFKRPFSKGSFCALPYCDTGYAIGDNAQIETQLISHLRAESEQASTAIEIRDVAREPTSKDALNEGLKVVMRLPLPEDSDTLLASFKSKLRSQIRKSEKNGLTFKLSDSWASHQSLLDDFYHVFKQNMRQLASPVHAKAWFTQILTHYDTNARLSVVYTNDIPIGCGIVLINGSTAAIPWASTVASYNRLAPNMMLYWSLLANVTDNGQKTFDFGRSTYGEGTYKFKSQWGALPYKLGWHDGTPHQAEEAYVPATDNRLRLLAESIWPKLPLGMTVALGSAVRKYISL